MAARYEFGTGRAPAESEGQGGEQNSGQNEQNGKEWEQLQIDFDARPEQAVTAREAQALGKEYEGRGATMNDAGIWLLGGAPTGGGNKAEQSGSSEAEQGGATGEVEQNVEVASPIATDAEMQEAKQRDDEENEQVQKVGEQAQEERGWRDVVSQESTSEGGTEKGWRDVVSRVSTSEEGVEEVVYPERVEEGGEEDGEVSVVNAENGDEAPAPVAESKDEGVEQKEQDRSKELEQIGTQLTAATFGLESGQPELYGLRQGVKEVDVVEKAHAKDKEASMGARLKNFFLRRKDSIVHSPKLSAYIAKNQNALERAMKNEGGEDTAQAKEALNATENRLLAAAVSGEDADMILRNGEKISQISPDDERYNAIKDRLTAVAQEIQAGQGENAEMSAEEWRQSIRDKFMEDSKAWQQEGKYLNVEKLLDGAMALGDYYKGVEDANERIDQFIGDKLTLYEGENAQMGPAMEGTVEQRRVEALQRKNALTEKILNRLDRGEFSGLIPGALIGGTTGAVAAGVGTKLGLTKMVRAGVVAAVGGAVGGAVVGAALGWRSGTRRFEERAILQNLEANEQAQGGGEQAGAEGGEQTGAGAERAGAAGAEQIRVDADGFPVGKIDAHYNQYQTKLAKNQEGKWGLRQEMSAEFREQVGDKLFRTYNANDVSTVLAQQVEKGFVGENGELDTEALQSAKNMLTKASALQQLEAQGYWVYRGNEEARTALGQNMAALRNSIIAAETESRVNARVAEENAGLAREGRGELGEGETDEIRQQVEREARQALTQELANGAKETAENMIPKNEQGESLWRKTIVRDRRRAGVRGAVMGGLVGGAMGAGAGAAIGEAVGDMVSSGAEVLSDTLGGNNGETLAAAATALETVDMDGDGDYELYNGDEKVADNIQFDANGALTVESQEAIESAGYTFEGAGFEAVEGNIVDEQLLPDERVSLTDYIAEHPHEVQEINASANSGEVTFGQVVSDGENGYKVPIYAQNGANVDLDNLQVAVDLGEGDASFTNLQVMTDENGGSYIEIPQDSPVASAVVKDPDVNGVFNMEAEALRVGTIAEDGSMNVQGEMAHGAGISEVQTYEHTYTREFTIAKDGEVFSFKTPDIVSDAVNETATGETLGGVLATVQDGATGQAEELHDLNATDAYDAATDPADLAGKEGINNFGPSVYKEGLSSTDLLEQTLAQEANSPEETELLKTALGMEGCATDVGTLNSLADEAMAGDYGARTDSILDTLMSKLDGGSVNTVDLGGVDHWTSAYVYDGADGSNMLGVDGYVAGTGGHALELLDSNGNNILDTTQIRDLYGIPYDQPGRFLLRTDCGGQVIFVPDDTIETVGEPGVPTTTTTTTVVDEPEPETPEPEEPTPEEPTPEEPTPEEPTPTPEEPEPEPEEPETPQPKGDNTHAGDDVDQRGVTAVPLTGIDNAVEADENGEAGRVTGEGDTSAAPRTEEQASATVNPDSAGANTDLSDDDLADVYASHQDNSSSEETQEAA